MEELVELTRVYCGKYKVRKVTEVNITKTSFEGLCIIEPIIFSDNRGSFFEAYSKRAFISYGLNYQFVQDNEVVSRKNVLRGMHVNIKHPQAKLIRVLDGEILDVVIDLRRNSKTYLSCYSIVLSDRNKKQLYIPEGMGHGYLALTDARVLFTHKTHYIPTDELGFAWNSEQITIDWGIESPIQNDRDRNNRNFSEVWK